MSLISGASGVHEMEHQKEIRREDGGFWSKNGTVSQISNALDILGEFRNGKTGGDRLKALVKMAFAAMSGGK